MSDPSPSSTTASLSLNGELARLIAVQICIHACMAGLRMAAPLLALRQGHSAAEVGIMLALYSLTQVFLSLPAGRFADRHGLKRPVLISICCTVFGAGLAADGGATRVDPAAKTDTAVILCAVVFSTNSKGRTADGWR